MKKFKAILISAISALGLASCSFEDVMTAVKDGTTGAFDTVKDATTGAFDKVKDVFVKDNEDGEGEPKQCSHVDEGKDHACDLCGEAMGEHKDLDGDGKCDYCAQDIPSVGSVTFEDAPSTIMVGKTVKLTAVANAVGGASSKVKYSIAEGTAATIDSNGNLTGVSLGTVVVKATSIADSSKFATVTIEVVEPNWSAESIKLMEENLHGTVLPFLGASWSSGEVDEDGSLYFESETGDLEAFKILLEEAGFTASLVNFRIDVQGHTAPGLAISKVLGDEGVVEAQLIDYTSYGYGFGFLVWYTAFMQWPATELAEFIGEHTETTIPVPAGNVVDAYEQPESEGYSAYIIDLIGDYQTYLTALQTAGYTGGLTQYEYYDLFSADGLLEVVLFPQSGSFEIQVLLSEPPAAEWSAAAIQLMSEQLHGVVIPFLGPTWSDPELDDGDIYTQSATGDLDALKTLFEEAGFSVSKVNFTVDQKGNTAPGLSISKEVEGVGVAKAQLIDFTGYGYGFELYAYFEEFMQWPATELAEFIGEHTEETVPQPVGKVVDAYEQPESEGYSAYIIDLNGDYQAYLTALEGAGFSGEFNGTYYDMYSATHLLEVVVFPGNGNFEIQVLLSEPPAPEFPSDVVAEYIGEHSTDTVPAADGTGFEKFVSKSGVLCINVTGDLDTYLGTLATAGYVMFDDFADAYGMYVGTSPAGNIDLVIYADEGMFQIQVYLVVAPQTSEYPASAVNEFTGAKTETVLPAPTARGFDVLGVDEDFYGDEYFAFVARYGDAYSYAYSLYTSGWGVDTSDYGKYGVIYAQSEDKTLYIMIFDNDYDFEVDVYAFAPAAAEFPSATVAAYIGEHSETVVPAAEGTAFNDVGICYDEYYEVVVTGDINAYAQLLLSSGFTDKGESYWGEYYLSADEKVLIDLSADYSGTAFYIDIYLVEPLVPADFPTADIEEFFEGLTEEVVPECFATEFKVYDEESYLEIQAYNASAKDYMGVLKEAGWDAEYDSYAYYNYATSPEESIKMTLIENSYGGYVTIILEYLEPKLTVWPTEAVATALGEKAKTTLPAAVGDDFTFDFTDNDNGSCIIDVYTEEGTTASYVETLTKAGFEVTEGSAEDFYWYLLSADKTVKVVVLDNLADGDGFFEIRAYGQDPSWTATSFDAAGVASVLGVSSEDIPNIADGEKFTFADKGNNTCEVTVDSGAKPDNYKAALVGAGFEQDASNPNLYSNGNIQVVIAVLDGITQKYSATFSVVTQPAGGDEWPVSTGLPEPTTYTSLTVTDNGETITIVVTGGNLAEYEEQLTGAISGLNVDDHNPSNICCYDDSFTWYFEINPGANGSYTIVI